MPPRPALSVLLQNSGHWPEQERLVKLDELIEKQKHEYYDRFVERVMNLYTHGLDADRIARRLCMKNEAS